LVLGFASPVEILVYQRAGVAQTRGQQAYRRPKLALLELRLRLQQHGFGYVFGFGMICDKLFELRFCPPPRSNVEGINRCLVSAVGGIGRAQRTER